MKRKSINESVTEAAVKKLSQSNVPKYRLEKAMEVARAIWDNYAGHPTTPIQVAMAMDISPTSSNWQDLPGASVAYGLTSGSYNAQQIQLTELGKKIVAPKTEDEDKEAIIEAVLKPRILNDFFTKYNRAKFPKDNIAINVLIDMGVPPTKAEQVLTIIKDNGKFAGILQEIKGNLYVVLDSLNAQNNINGNNSHEDESSTTEPLVSTNLIVDNTLKDSGRQKPENPISENLPERAKVFISHGKNKKIVEQIKEILKFGQFEVLVSVEKEATAISVPDKVFSDMRACSAAVIHIEGEQKFLDEGGNEHFKINENVLIEIGAAMALYGRRFVLLCEKSVQLPSNLQGIYRCEYEGSELNYESTIKLLKTFNEFRK